MKKEKIRQENKKVIENKDRKNDSGKVNWKSKFRKMNEMLKSMKRLKKGMRGWNWKQIKIIKNGEKTKREKRKSE